jgi:hypothetical protein
VRANTRALLSKEFEEAAGLALIVRTIPLRAQLSQLTETFELETQKLNEERKKHTDDLEKVRLRFSLLETRKDKLD